MVTDSSGNPCFEADYYPYGQENDYTTTCSPTYKFTGYESDAETRNDYAYARYYDPRIGRFLTADPLNGGLPASPATPSAAGVASVDAADGVFPFAVSLARIGLPTSASGAGAACPGCGCGASSRLSLGVSNPQSLNHYAYGLNNPETSTDAHGLYNCAGTTDCSYYNSACSASSYWWAAFYYCGAARSACSTFGRTAWTNCVRLCLQENDFCFGMQSAGLGAFNVCIAQLHFMCFYQCHEGCQP